MKSILLMRHAKSSHDDEGRPDHDRPLNDRGRKAAPRMARRIADAGLTPDRLLCSTARRARETADLFVAETGYAGPVARETRLYHAAPDAILAVLAEAAGDADRVLLVGHNPGLEQLVERLTGSAEHLPTAAVARIELPIDAWELATDPIRGRLVDFWTPKDDE